MNLRRLTYSIIFIITPILSGCETEADTVKLPPFEQKLVVSAFISPSDSISYFMISSNKKIFGELGTEEPLGLLSGKISDGINEVSLDTCSIGLKLEHKKMQIGFGKTYNLILTSENGLSAEASSSVPEKKNIVMTADTFSRIVKYPDYYNPVAGATYYRAYDFNVKINDIQGEENFYRVFGKYSIYTTTHNPERRFIYSSYLTFDQEFISDIGMDGKTISLSTENQYSGLFPQGMDSILLIIYRYDTEKSYYRFHKTLSKYKDGEKPFSEAAPVYSNISGGLGIFSAFTIDSLVTKFVNQK